MHMQKVEKSVHHKRMKAAVTQRGFKLVPRGWVVLDYCVEIAGYGCKCA
jgi:hypothetical protein